MSPGPLPRLEGSTEPGLYVGSVRHRRLRPRAHAFTYPVFMAYLDIDHLEALCAVSPRLGYNRWAWAGFDQRDHLGDPALPLRERFRRDAEAQGFAFPEGPALLLTNLRYWGYCFNPVSYLYCHDPEGRLVLIAAEVTNTPWKERHVYWMKVADGQVGKGGASFRVPKVFHVSPFMAVEGHYRWAFGQPGHHLKVHISEFSGEEFFFDASLSMTKAPWAASEIHRVLWRFPWMTLKVITAIHWEALKLWIKRTPVHTHPGKRKPAGA